MTRPLRLRVNTKLPARASAFVFRIRALPTHLPAELVPAWKDWTAHPSLGGGSGNGLVVGGVDTDGRVDADVEVLVAADVVADDVVERGADDRVVVEASMLDDAGSLFSPDDPPHASAVTSRIETVAHNSTGSRCDLVVTFQPATGACVAPLRSAAAGAQTLPRPRRRFECLEVGRPVTRVRARVEQRRGM
jgi:hypothetical protein